jgi:hypothetical protein
VVWQLAGQQEHHTACACFLFSGSDSSDSNVGLPVVLSRSARQQTNKQRRRGKCTSTCTVELWCTKMMFLGVDWIKGKSARHMTTTPPTGTRGRRGCRTSNDLAHQSAPCMTSSVALSILTPVGVSVTFRTMPKMGSRLLQERELPPELCLAPAISESAVLLSMPGVCS